MMKNKEHQSLWTVIKKSGLFSQNPVRMTYEISYEQLMILCEILNGPGNRKTLRRKIIKMFRPIKCEKQ